MDLTCGLWLSHWDMVRKSQLNCCPESWSILPFGSHLSPCCKVFWRTACHATSITSLPCLWLTRSCGTNTVEHWHLTVMWELGISCFQATQDLCVLAEDCLVKDERLADEVEVPNSYNMPYCKMSAVFFQYWLSLLVLYSHFIMQIELGRLTFQWTCVVLFNGKVAI